MNVIDLVSGLFQQIVFGGNKMELSFLNRTEYLLDVWSKKVSENPSARMLTDECHPHGLSRRAVDDLSGKVYAWLREKQISREDFVLLCLPRGAAALVCMLGVWKAGAAFTMVEDNYPPERITYIKKDCGCKTVIDIHVWNDEILKTEALPGYEETSIHDAALAIYTSGTTGNPKGVLHEYGSIKMIQAAAVDRRTGKPRLVESDRLSLVTPLNFNASIRRYINALYAGCNLHIVSYSIIKNPLQLRQYLLDNRITVMCASPSLLRMIQDPGPYVRQIQISSEPANGLFFEGPELVNAYAMSESGFPVAEFIIDKPYDECPVGKPNIEQIHIRVMDEEGNEIPSGTPGEITVENPFFRGYINLPEQTQKVLQNGVYHTGDIGKKLPDGNLVLIGRSTDMIKINGNRIEPAEIEAVGKKVLGVDWCAARGFEDPIHAFVCLYYVEDISFDEMEVRRQMERYLPYYMIPAYFMKVDEIPMLANGKMNRRALPKPQPDTAHEEYIAPRTKTEQILCEAFEKALGIDQVGVHDSFYHLGGDSLGTMRVLAQAHLPGLSAKDIFEGCTPEHIAEMYESRQTGALPEDVAVTEERERKKAHPLTPNQIEMFDYTIFAANAISWNLPRLYRFPADMDAQRLCDAVNKAIANRPALYTIFEFNEECTLVQRIAPEKKLRLSVENISEAEFKTRSEDLERPFRMIGEPLIHAGIYQTEEAVYLFFEVHHIMTDGMGMHLLNEDIVRAFHGEDLSPDTYYTYLYHEERLHESKKYREDQEFLEKAYGQDDWCYKLNPDVAVRPDGRVILQLKRVVDLKEIQMFEEKHHVSRNRLYTAATLLGMAAIERKNKVMLDWVFHDRTDDVRKNAFGCVFRYVTVGVEISKDMTLGDFLKSVSERTNEGLAHCAYEWSLKRNNVYDHDALFIVYETAEIMSTNDIGSIKGTRLNVESHARFNTFSMAIQMIENPGGISAFLVMNQTIYSEQKMKRMVDVFSDLVDIILKAENPDRIMISDCLSCTNLYRI